MFKEFENLLLTYNKTKQKLQNKIKYFLNYTNLNTIFLLIHVSTSYQKYLIK